jgi:hypothetical protein
MSYSEMAHIANEISRWAVLISLIYVALQTRLSVRHMRAQIQQGTAARTVNILFGWMDPEAISVWIEGNGGTPTPELIKQRQFYCHCGIAMIAMEDYFSQHEMGLLNDEQFARGSHDQVGAQLLRLRRWSLHRPNGKTLLIENATDLR